MIFAEQNILQSALGTIIHVHIIIDEFDHFRKHDIWLKLEQGVP